MPLFPPLYNVTVRNITCECGNGLTPVVWTPVSAPGVAGDLRDIVFDGAKFVRSAMAVMLKSIPPFIGTVSNVTYKNFELVNVTQAFMVTVNTAHADAPVDQPALGHTRDLDLGLATYRDIKIINVSGTVATPGFFHCSNATPCTEIYMENVVLRTSGPSAYSCNNAFGKFKACEPHPCLSNPSPALYPHSNSLVHDPSHS